MIDYSDDDEIDCTAGVAVYDYSPVCAHCGAAIREVDDNYDNQGRESVCIECYVANVEPFEVWDDDKENVIGYRTMAIAVFSEDDDAWGVDVDGAIMYESDMSELLAKTLASLHNGTVVSFDDAVMFLDHYGIDIADLE